MGCYAETFAFLGDIGALDNVSLQPQLAVTMIDRMGLRTRLVCPDLPAPLNLVAGVLEWDALEWRDRLSVLGMITPLKNARRELQPGSTVKASSAGETVENWLIRNGQTPRLQEMLWNPLALAALNQPPDQAAAPVFARVLAEMLGGNARAAAIGLPTKPLHMMYAEPARRFIENRGGQVRTGTAAKILVDAGAVTGIQAGEEQWHPGTVISSVPWFALADLFDAEPPELRELIARARQMASSPIVTVNLWFNRRVLDEPFIGLPGREMQWVFDKPLVLGDEAASHLSLVSSGAAARKFWRRCPTSVRRACCERRSCASRAPRSPSPRDSRRARRRKRACADWCWRVTGSRPVYRPPSRARCDRDTGRQNSASGNRIIW
jgi:hypothetical protein